MPTKPPSAGTSSRLVFAYVVLILLAVAAALYERTAVSEPRYEISYSHFRDLVEQGQVEEIYLKGTAVSGELRSLAPIGPEGREARLFRSRVPDFGQDELLVLLEQHEVSISVEDPEERGRFSVFVALLPWLIFLLVIFWLFRAGSRAISGSVGRAGLKSFLQLPGAQAEVPDVSFDDVAGQDNAKRDVQEIVEFLKNPESFRRIGAEVPRGVLLMGPPGTGKTLMARALAGEAGVPFYSVSGSEFIEVFVGVGAARVRSLFESAKKDTPSIIFIDELDSVGRTRGTGLGGGHDEREQTLNQILAEMDGFTGHEAVIVLAATNRPDVLDPALLRPGRFDRHVTLDLPDRKDRVAILNVHVRRVSLAPDVDLDHIAAGTPGFSGADLKNLVNEAAMITAHAHRKKVSSSDFDEARDKLVMGAVRNLAIGPEERHRLAVHEGGHTIVAYCLPHADPLFKVTIIPRGQALGGTHQLPEDERYTLPEEYLLDRLAVILAGRAAEETLLGSVSSGADDDIRQATKLARAMVARWGMSEDIGPVDLRESEEHPFLGREVAQPRRYSEHSAAAVDEAVSRLLKDAEGRAEAIVVSHRGQLERLVAMLEERETLGREQIESCMRSSPDVRLQGIGK